jgi:hypothetical protein
MLDGDDTNFTCLERIVSQLPLAESSLTTDSVLLCSKSGMPPTRQWHRFLGRTSQVIKTCARGSSFHSSRHQRRLVPLPFPPSTRPLQAPKWPVLVDTTPHNLARLHPTIRYHLMSNTPPFLRKRPTLYNTQCQVYLRIHRRCILTTT